MKTTAEHQRLIDYRQRKANWKKWGPYLSERQWGTVREDYSEIGTAWDFFPHDQARSKAYRWNEDGLAGISDDQQYLCFALALWNGRDAILKERLFGLTNSEGNHGEDVKEYYFYLDSTPTHSYMKYLYKYPQAEFPYERLVEENRLRPAADPAAAGHRRLPRGRGAGRTLPLRQLHASEGAGLRRQGRRRRCLARHRQRSAASRRRAHGHVLQHRPAAGLDMEHVVDAISNGHELMEVNS